MLHNGLYEQIINKGLDTELSVTDKLSQTAPIDSAEASKVLAKYVATSPIIIAVHYSNPTTFSFHRINRCRQPYDFQIALNCATTHAELYH